MAWATPGGAALALAAFIGIPPLDQPAPVHLDQSMSIGGVDVGCTGIGQTKNDPRWLAYSVRLVFAGPGGDYLANEVVTLSDEHGARLLQVSCEGPWVLLKLARGKTYHVEARIEQAGSAPKTATVRAPAHGQAITVFTFPDAH